MGVLTTLQDDDYTNSLENEEGKEIVKITYSTKDQHRGNHQSWKCHLYSSLQLGLPLDDLCKETNVNRYIKSIIDI